MTHNEIQRSCTGSELVLGSVYGMRQWYLNPPGWSGGQQGLEGHTGYRWSLRTKNTATCQKTDEYVTERVIGIQPQSASDSVTGFALNIVDNVERLFEKYPDSNLISSIFAGGVFNRGEDYLGPAMAYTVNAGRSTLSAEYYLSPLIPIPPHDIGDPICTCGFYAYTDRQSLERNSHAGIESTYFGIIKAYGFVTEGTEGFRAEHAEIVGLTQAMVNDYDIWRPAPNWMIGETILEQSVFPLTLPRYQDLDDMVRRYEELSVV